MGLKLHAIKGRIEAGVDEAGRGCLAGPVTAAAVIPGSAGMAWLKDGLNDSKQMKAAARQSLRARIEAEAAAWAVGTKFSLYRYLLNLALMRRCRQL